jgi:hippurate hydrolase
MRAAGYDVTEHVGGFGLVCLLKNGAGPTVLIRTDMDALPVEEKTGLPYASKARGKDREGKDMPIMHACGHDAHMASWVGTARTLADMMDRWHGTLMFIAQPAEEIGMGARLMLEDGLFKRFPKPDYALALHCSATVPFGSISYTEGPALANVDSVDIIVKGRGGHGSAPHTTVDPIVLAARIVLDLQTLVSREKDPLEPAVVTVGSIHGGLKHNIIPSEVTMLLTIRSYKDSVRKQILEGIERIVKAAALSAKAPEPEVKIREDEFTPATVNDPELVRKTVAALKAALGDSKLLAYPPSMGGEDFSRYGREGVPIFMFQVGTQPQEKVDESKRPGGKPLPSLHSDLFYPIPEPTIKTAVLAMSLAVLNLVGK